METILQEIRDERQRQDDKWGVAAQRNLPPYTWIAVLLEEVGEVARGALEKDYINYCDELIQVAAVCVAALEDARAGPDGKPATRTNIIVPDANPDSFYPKEGGEVALKYLQERADD